MKINKILLGLALVAGGLFTSCDTDNVGTKYNVYTPSVSFLEESTSMTTSESSVEVQVKLVRLGNSGPLTVHYTGSSETAGIFTDLSGGQATFEEGSSTAVVTIKADNMQKGQEYTYSLQLDDAAVATADTILNNQIAVSDIVIMCDYNWVPAGSCTFIDNTFSEGDVIEGVKIENGEGSNVYRIVDVYGNGTGYITFIQNADGTIKLAEGKHCTVSGYTIYYDSENFGDYCYVESNGNHYVVNHLLLAGSDLYLGGFEFTWNK
jgi:hypothetical protein